MPSLRPVAIDAAMSDDSKRGCLAPLLIVAAIAAVVFFSEAPKPPSIYTPGVMPDPANKSEWEILGPNFKKREQATSWAVSKAAEYGPQASWIVYRVLFWNEQYGMPIAQEKLR